jgi:hypothetical protein
VWSTVALFLLAFAVRGLLPGLAASHGTPELIPLSPAEQASLFGDRIQQASSDGELAENEYYACAYNIYS